MEDTRKLEDIRGYVAKVLGKKRFSHTLGVEREMAVLAEIFLRDKSEKLRAAALLHDITKELDVERQRELCKKYALSADTAMERSPKLYHALTGAYVARELFPDIIDDEAFDAIRYHTTGRRGMKLCEKLLYLADYIEDTRTFEDCVLLRSYFYEGIDRAASKEEKYMHLQKTLLKSFDMTISGLESEGAFVDPTTIDARAFIMEEIAAEA